jgi:hypothetical protein
MPVEFGRDCWSVAGGKKLEKLDKNTPLEIRELMLDAAVKQAEIDVFGHGFRRDAQGRPIEQGIGSPSNSNEQHFVALEKSEGKAVADAARAKAAKRAATT